ncbi:MAG TPA: hypothetical protein VNA19_12215 [Pyrinomonadaceae bacterium]|jgi:cell division protein FtsB|nr:hypothetical protein [Pyrinomonadaceae bacterium]
MLRRFVSVFLLAALFGLPVAAQSPPDAEQRAEGLRSQLRGLADRETELQTRAQRLEEELKPENIQRSVAHIGTTRPEDLREQRRLQLEKERASVQAQLEEIRASRTRLEAAVAAAEAAADRLRMNAATPPAPPASNNVSNVPATTVAPAATVSVPRPAAKRSNVQRRRGKVRRRATRSKGARS